MNKIAILEYVTIAACTMLLLILIIPSLQHARREVRDGERREAVAKIKRTMEDVNNTKGYYPVSFSAAPYEYYVIEKEGEKAIRWYLRAEMENTHAASSSFDAEEGHNFLYRYVQNGATTYFDVCGGDLACDIQ